MNADDKESFFYANAAAAMYEGTIGLVVPQYRLMHDLMLRLVRQHFLRFAQGDRSLVQGAILDVGSGTGTDILHVLSEFPGVSAVALDFCENMCQMLRSKLSGSDNALSPMANRCAVVKGDILGEAGVPAQLKSHLSANHFSGYHAVLTSLTVHHFEHHEKQAFYKRIYQVLEPGGILINGDLFSYVSNDLSDDALAFDLKWMHDQFLSPNPEFREAQFLPAHERSRLCRLWTNHYLVHNRLEPIEDSLEEPNFRKGQAAMLREAGFRLVATTYRYSLSGILWARK